MNRDRRSAILKAVLLVQLLCLFLSAKVLFGQARPDLILVNGKIFTSNAAHPYVQAQAISGERIIATGDSAKMRALAGDGTRTIDLGGRTVIPVINDAHLHLWIHPANWIQLQAQGPDPAWSELKAAIVKAPKGVGLIADIGLNVFYDTTVNRDSLDQIAPDQPVMLSSLAWMLAASGSAMGRQQSEPHMSTDREILLAIGKVLNLPEVRERATALGLSKICE